MQLGCVVPPPKSAFDGLCRMLGKIWTRQIVSLMTPTIYSVHRFILRKLYTKLEHLVRDIWIYCDCLFICRTTWTVAVCFRNIHVLMIFRLEVSTCSSSIVHHIWFTTLWPFQFMPHCNCGKNNYQGRTTTIKVISNLVLPRDVCLAEEFELIVVSSSWFTSSCASSPL